MGVMSAALFLRSYFPGGSINPVAVVLLVVFHPLCLLWLFADWCVCKPVCWLTLRLAGFRRSRRDWVDAWVKRCPTCGTEFY